MKAYIYIFLNWKQKEDLYPVEHQTETDDLVLQHTELTGPIIYHRLE